MTETETAPEHAHTSHTPAETTPETDAVAPAATEPSLSTVEALRVKLAESPVPLKFGELKKTLTKPKKTKGDAWEAEIKQLLEEEIAGGRAFTAPSAKGGENRYWNRDEKLTIRDAVLAAAIEPKPLAQLKKVARDTTRADKAFAEPLVDELVASSELHPQSAKANAKYGREKPLSPNHEGKVTDALLKAAETPQKFDKLVKAAIKETAADKDFVESILNALIQSGQLHAQSSGDKPTYGREQRNDETKVKDALLRLAESPKKIAQLVTAAVKETKADKEFVESVLKTLIETKQLHPQSAAETPTYGIKEWEKPHAYEVKPGKGAFDALVKAGRKLLDTVPSIPIDELVQQLRAALQRPVSPPPQPDKQITGEAGKSPPPPPPVSSGHYSPAQIDAALKSAYEELCLDVEFQDRVVELRRLYHEAARALPGLTVEKFHHELERLQHARTVELQPLNEVQRAKEPELAMHRGDRLLYYAIWR